MLSPLQLSVIVSRPRTSGCVFSTTYALFHTNQSCNPFQLHSFRTPSQKHPVGGSSRPHEPHGIRITGKMLSARIEPKGNLPCPLHIVDMEADASRAHPIGCILSGAQRE